MRRMKGMEMTTPEEVLLPAAAEMANWARHYDTVRIQLIGLVLALTGAAVSFAISTSDDRTRVLLLVVSGGIGVALTVLSAEYTRLYYERSAAESELIQLATEYQSGERSPASFSRFKLVKKAHEAYFEAFDEDGPSVEGLDDEAGASRLKDGYGGFGVLNWRWSMFHRLVASFWLWLSLGVGFLLPLYCLVRGVRRESR